ncbi:MAG: ABC transporter ATP-binding protein [Acidobacteria bacterium]|nr:ABC transporter ATP-binding protein [Acidobacteriota bacterium]
MRLSLSASTRSPSPKLALEGVALHYGAITALDAVSLEVRDREILCLLGPSGSGKSTLLRLVAGIERPAAGRILLEGVEVAGPTRFVEPERRHVGMVFQDYALFPHLTIAENVAFGLRGRSRSEIDGIVAALLDRVNLRRYATNYPHMLSGGERQRVALARALAPRPRVLLMDEPFSSLDGRLRDDIRRHAMALLRDTGTTTVVVTHDPDEAMRIADRIALLHGGRLVECARPDDLYARPLTLAAARIFSELNELCGTCVNGVVHTPLGSFAAPHLEDRTAAKVCIRPHHLRFASNGDGIPAQVMSTTFLGELEHLSLAVANIDMPLSARVLGRTHLRPRDTVYLEVRPEDVVIVPQDDTIQASPQPSIGALQ